MIGWKSMIHSCSLDTGISRPSAIAPRTFMSGRSSESAEKCEWMWKSAHITPVESTLCARDAAMVVVFPSVAVDGAS
jgi:hypothetical protein